MAKKRVTSNGVVQKFLRFQKGRGPFDPVWVDVEPIVREFAGRSLVRLGVKSFGVVDEWAVDDVVQQTVLTLTKLGERGASGRFDPAKTQPGISGFRGWLWKVVESQAVNWWREYRGGRRFKIVAESALPLNQLPSGDEPKSFFDRLLAKVERPDLLPLLNECIAELPEPLQRLLRLRLDENLSHRQTAARIGSSAPVVGRRLQDAYAILRTLLEARGFDFDAWLAA